MLMTRPVAYYTERSAHFLDRVDDELAAGELEVACEMLWGSAAHAVKAAAESKGWPHGTHRRLADVVERLINDGWAPPHISGQYKMASDFHQGFYGDRQFSAAHIRFAQATIADFTQTLRRLT